MTNLPPHIQEAIAHSESVRCGCVLTGRMCAMHEAAPDLLAALEQMWVAATGYGAALATDGHLAEYGLKFRDAVEASAAAIAIATVTERMEARLRELAAR